MFTGLVKATGIVESIRTNAEGREINIDCPEIASDLKIDDSVAINGACQTAVKVSKSSFMVQVVKTTLEKTTLSSLKTGDEVNLELAMKLSDRLGGHLVQGHINSVGEITSIKSNGENYILSVKYQKELNPYFIAEGSVAIDGVSLTICSLEKEISLLSVSVIPHTWSHTILRSAKVGQKVNLEVDVIAKYVESLLFDRSSSKSKVTLDRLTELGY